MSIKIRSVSRRFRTSAFKARPAEGTSFPYKTLRVCRLKSPLFWVGGQVLGALK